MGTLIILGTAILGGLVCSKQTLYQSWIFLVNLAFSVYLALLLAPLVRDLAQPSLNLSRELAPYLTPAAMLVLFLVLIILLYKITDAVVHDSKVFEDILDEKNTSRDVYADSAYRSAEHEADLKQRKFRPHLQRKGCKGHQLTSWKKRGNLTRARIRSRIEHVFGAIHQRAGDIILRTIGISMAEVKLGLRNIAYNMDRFCTLMLQNA